jgi:hypothetical protein
MPTEREPVSETAFKNSPLAPANNLPSHERSPRGAAEHSPLGGSQGRFGEGGGRSSFFVMPGKPRRTASLPLAYVPGIHVFLSATFPDKTWMAGTRLRQGFAGLGTSPRSFSEGGQAPP